MTIRNLDHLFRPASVAVLGASARPASVGATVLANLLAGGFTGPILPVNPKYYDLRCLKCFARIADLPLCPDLAVICTPANTVPGLIAELGAAGCKAVIVLSAGFSGPERQALRQSMLDAARPHLLRILGPNCIGLLAPHLGLNASFAPTNALPGKLAFVTQSGALATAVLDWANTRNIGFSHFVSLGDSADVDVADVLDYLSRDPDTEAILLYLEGLRSGRKFLSAARAASRHIPLVVVKSGRVGEAVHAAASHTGAMAGSDIVFDAVFRRAGMLRVNTTEALFNAVESFARARFPAGGQLAILTNGGGPGVMAADALLLQGGGLAQLSPSTLGQLDAVLPQTWSHGNPVDIVGDAPVSRYLQAMQILQSAPEVDAILLLHAPTAIVESDAIATGLLHCSIGAAKPLLTGWLGGLAVARAQVLCRAARIPVYDTPEMAVQSFLQLVEYQRNQTTLLEVPPGEAAVADLAAAKTAIHRAMRAGRSMLTEPEAKTVLAAFGIPVAATRAVITTEEAAHAADAMGYPVVLKILSPDITHKSDVGGVALDLHDAQSVRKAAIAMLERVALARPEAKLEGFSVQRMMPQRAQFELIVGISSDPVFGPVVVFGHGGTAVEKIGDIAAALPPLNRALARDLVGRTRISRLLSGFRSIPPVAMDALADAIVAVSRMACELANLAELDINPLLANADGVVALDARIVLRRNGDDPRSRLAIMPYPTELVRTVTWNGEQVRIRPVRPDDAARLGEFLQRLTQADQRTRSLCGPAGSEPLQLARMTQIDYAREMCFVAERRVEGRETPEIIGECRMLADPDNVRAEMAMAVRSDCQRQGPGVHPYGRLGLLCAGAGHP